MGKQAKKTLNRIILIGNGFDLAHGLKTKYEHFINDFWERAFEDYKINKGKDIPTNEEKNERENKTNFKPFFKIAKEKEIEEGTYTVLAIDDFKHAISYENKFLEKIERDIQIKTWCNIEKLYFDELVRCYKDYKAKEDRNDTTQIDKLNGDFDAIENELRQYLKKEIEKEYKKGENGTTREALIKENALNSNFLTNLQDEFEKAIWNDDVNEYKILTCNYTKTAELYENRIKNKGKKAEVVYIHGKLESDIIFGYGDEHCEEAKEIEKLDENKFQQKIKQIKYAETPDYMVLDEFITNKGEYDVVVLGHSCGNADRTLLRRLLESGNCKSIIPYYYNDTDKREKQHNIYRIFDDKQKFQERITPVQEWRLIPSIDRMNKTPLELLLESNFVKVEKPTTGKYRLLENDVEKEIKQDFSIGKYQVTQQLWHEIMDSNPSYFQANGAKKPVEQVSWYDCVKFCNALSQKYGLDNYYKINKDIVKLNGGANGFRLPAEAEWEYAARYYSRNDKVESKIYAGSKYNKDNDDESELEKYAWFYKNSNDRTHEVGMAKNAKELAIHDMSGNVWEWCENDWEGKLANEQQGSDRVLRGGSWGISAQYCRVSDRYNTPGSRSYYIGFRLALSS
ncbi:MAG: SUMF1/EgtB/PvdO family nonheme iron enzyme [Bacteroidales bacterium]|nr:SUMF1/EgtB/PvdO family nonheme iron enzyme [Bacteroidales bacterium]